MSSGGAARTAGSAGPGPDVLVTKLARPRVPRSFLLRPQVDRLLTAGADKPLTLVSAGAGWGKTLVAAHWAAEISPHPVGWVSFDPGDNNPDEFWKCFVAGLHSAGAIPAGAPLAAFVPGLGEPSDGVRRLSAGLAALSADVVLVLDDFHLITDPSIMEQLAELLRRPVPRLHLTVLTRSDPALPLHRLRMTDDLAEVRPRDLAFGAEDAAELLASHDVSVNATDATALVDRTEGWPAGLRLAALFLGRPDTGRSVGDFAGDDRATSTYLAEEVLASLAPDLQQFLLRTSVAERLSSGLAEVLSDQAHSQQHLETLEGTNAFVVGIGPGQTWFRYHALLREMLQHRLLVTEPDLIPELHRRAARWYGDHGYPIEALRHAVEAEDWHGVGEIFVTQACPLLVSVERTSLNAVLGRIPVAHLADSPPLALCAAGRALLDGRLSDVQPHVDLAERLLETSAEPGDADRIALLLLSTVAARSCGDIAALTDAASVALEVLAGKEESLPAAASYRAVALSNLGVGLLWSGDVAEAYTVLLEALDASTSSGVETARVSVLAHLALAATTCGRLTEGYDYGRQAVELVESRGWASLPQVATAYLALAMVHVQRNELATARALLVDGDVAGGKEAAVRWALAIVRARLYASEGCAQAARAELLQIPASLASREDTVLLARWRALAEVEIDLAEGDAATATMRVAPPRDRQFPYVEEQSCLARAALAAGDPRRAEDLLRPVRGAAEGGSALVEVWLLTALAADRLRDDNRALAAVRHAVSVAAQEGVRRPFATLPREPVLRSLERLRGVSPDLTDRVDDLLAGSELGGSEDPAPTAPVEQLTERELSVLQFLPTMMTNNEIAAELYVSVNTVKAHLKRIFRKLEVASRRHAVLRARELGILDTRDVLTES